MKELLIEVLSQKTALTNGAATEVSSIGHFYMITNLKFQWSEVSEKQCSTLHKISSDQISSIQVDNICKVSVILLHYTHRYTLVYFHYAAEMCIPISIITQSAYRLLCSVFRHYFPIKPIN